MYISLVYLHLVNKFVFGQQYLCGFVLNCIVRILLLDTIIMKTGD